MEKLTAFPEGELEAGSRSTPLDPPLPILQLLSPGLLAAAPRDGLVSRELQQRKGREVGLRSEHLVVQGYGQSS